MPKIKNEQGRNAARSGRALEDKVEKILNTLGLPTVDYAHYMNASHKPKEAVIHNHHYTGTFTPYKKDNKKCRGEFLIVSSKLTSPVMVECRSQTVGGTADQKTPKLYLDAVEAEHDHVILVVEGNGFSDGVIAWLRNAAESRSYIVKENTSKNIEVMSLHEFENWCNKTLLLTKNA
jgi:hypothetical protein